MSKLKDQVEFAEGDSVLLGTKISESLNDFIELSAEDFKTFERFCSGSSLSGGFAAAQQWAIDHLKELEEDARSNEDSEYGYGLPMGYCTFAANAAVVAYETTSGTILLCTAEEQYAVYVPIGRREGFHFTILLMVKAHASADVVDRFVNSHKYETEAVDG